VERVLAEIPGVAGCAVVGVPDERLGQRVVAAVVLEDNAHVTSDDLERWCAAALARYKVPERFVFVADLPRNAMGKMAKQQVVPLVLG
jgi:acyl-CoA synthetase (AMP-forming)/AMP-acid ligase II